MSSPSSLFPVCPSCRHQKKAAVVERSATDALSVSEKSLALVRTLMEKEYKVKELIGDLKTMWVTSASLGWIIFPFLIINRGGKSPKSVEILTLHSESYAKEQHRTSVFLSLRWHLWREAVTAGVLLDFQSVPSLTVALLLKPFPSCEQRICFFLFGFCFWNFIVCSPRSFLSFTHKWVALDPPPLSGEPITAVTMCFLIRW